MVESGYFGSDKICLAASSFNYDVINRNLERYGRNEAVFWSLVDCPYKVVIIEITAVFEMGEATHANVLIVNKTNSTWEIERFEPHGQVERHESYGEGDLLFNMQERIDEDLKKWFTKTLGEINQPFTYRRPIDICPRRGPQTRSEEFEYLGGFCQTWTLFYIDMRISHPEMTSDELLTIMFEMDAKELYEMIQDYVHFVKETDVPKAFEEYLDSKRLMVMSYEFGIQDIKAIPKFTNNEKTEISHEFYKVIAKMPLDKKSVDVWNDISYWIRSIIVDYSYPVVAPIIKAIQGKYLDKSMGLKDDLQNYERHLSWKSEQAPEYLASILATLGS